MIMPPEIVAESLANEVCGEEGYGTKHWQDIKSAFLAGYIECLNNWKWKGVRSDGTANDDQPGRTDSKVVSLDRFRGDNRK
jgi:hypothetical protein